MSAPHPEDFCERCGRENCVWFAPSELWNRAARVDGYDPMLCPTCFIKAAEFVGIQPTAWVVAPEVFDVVSPDDQENDGAGELPTLRITLPDGAPQQGNTTPAQRNNGSGATPAGGESGLPHHNTLACPKPPRTPRKARKPLPPSSHPIPRGGKPKLVNRKRKASEFARTYHSKARVEFVKSLPCLYCALLPLRQPLGPSENAHTTGGGMGRKGDYTTISPLCQKHHAMYDEHRAPFDQPELRGWVAECAEIVEAGWRASGRDGE